MVNSRAKTRKVLEDSVNMCNFLISDDYVVLRLGSNHVAGNETRDCIRTLLDILPMLAHTNVVIVGIPHRYDLISLSYANNEIEKTNRKILKINIKCLLKVQFLGVTQNRDNFTVMDCI